MMNPYARHRLAHLDGAVRGALAAQLRDYARGAISRDDLDEAGRRRANAIRANYRGGLVAPPSSCADCHIDVDPEAAAMIDGKLYCQAHAGAHRKPAPARRA